MLESALVLQMAAVIPLFISPEHAEMDGPYHLTAETSRTLKSLATKFIFGCIVLVSGIVAAALISRKK